MPTRFHLGATIPVSSNAAGFMSALETLFAVGSDVDTAAAVTGIMTWTRDNTAGSEAMYSSPFGPRNTRIIMACHDSGTPSPSPVMIGSSDLYATSNILIGICDDAAGTYIGWNQTSPFYVAGSSGTGCYFPGYWRHAAVSTLSSVRAILSSKDLILQMVSSSGVTTSHYGAILSAPTGWAESDGFRYGGMVSGVGDMSNSWRSTDFTNPGCFLKHSTSNGGPHLGIFGIGTSSWVLGNVDTIFTTSGAQSVDTHKWDATTHARIGIAVRKFTAPLYILGAWNGISESCQGMSGQNVTGTGNTSVRISASVITTNEDSVLVWRTY